MGKLFESFVIILITLIFCFTAFAESSFVKTKLLTIDDVQSFFRINIDKKGFRQSMKIDEFVGVYQNDKEAMVYYRWSGIEGGAGKRVNNVFHSDRCINLNDGRWLCNINNNRVNVDAFLKRINLSVNDKEGIKNSYKEFVKFLNDNKNINTLNNFIYFDDGAGATKADLKLFIKRFKDIQSIQLIDMLPSNENEANVCLQITSIDGIVSDETIPVYFINHKWFLIKENEHSKE